MEEEIGGRGGLQRSGFDPARLTPTDAWTVEMLQDGEVVLSAGAGSLAIPFQLPKPKPCKYYVTNMRVIAVLDAPRSAFAVPWADIDGVEAKSGLFYGKCKIHFGPAWAMLDSTKAMISDIGSAWAQYRRQTV